MKKYIKIIIIILLAFLSIFIFNKMNIIHNNNIEHFENNPTDLTTTQDESNVELTNTNIPSESTSTIDDINIASDQTQSEADNIQVVSAEQETINNINTLTSSGYLNTVNDMLTNKLDVIDSKLQNKLAQFETNIINFKTIPDDSGVDGGFNICNTSSSGSTFCSYMPHPNGSTYIRPGKTDGDINIDNAKNINLSSSSQNILLSKNNTLITNSSDGTNALCGNGTNAMCSHLPYGDNNSYIRPAKKNGWVYIGHNANDIGGVSLKSKQNQFLSGDTDYSSYLPNANGNSYIRPGKDDGNIYIGHQPRTGQAENTEATNVISHKSKQIDICSSLPNGMCSHFPWTDGNTYIRPGQGNKNILINNADEIKFSANKYSFTKNNDGSGETTTFTQNELAMLKTLANVNSDELNNIKRLDEIDITKVNNVLKLDGNIDNLLTLAAKQADIINSISIANDALTKATKQENIITNTPNIPNIPNIPNTTNTTNTTLKPTQLLSSILISAKNNYINLAGLKILDANGINLLTSTAVNNTKSKMFNPFNQANSYPISNLWDADVNNLTHTSFEVAPYLLIVLNSPVKASKIILLNRKDCCQDRISGGSLIAYDSLNNIIAQKILNADLSQELNL